MKIVEKIILVIYSILILILASIFCLLIFKWIDLNNVYFVIKEVLENSIGRIIILTISIICILSSIKCIFFLSKKNDYKKNLLFKNDDGKLVITKATIENIVNNVIKKFTSAQEINTKVKFNKENNIVIKINLLMKEEVNMKDLSDNIQRKIKETIKRTSDLNVQEVDIKIKNIEKVEEKKNIEKIER